MMVSIKLVDCIVFTCIIFVFLPITKGRNSRMLFSQKQFHETQKLKVIKTKNGDVYNCVDFYEQPAFKHPQLQNHKFYPQMRPKFVPNITTTKKNNVEMSTFQILENGGCPHGTVPIRRLSEDDRSREAMFSKAHIYNFTNAPDAPPGTHFAILQTKSNPSPPNYYGVGAHISIWNPQVKENQYSAAQLTIQNGLDSLQVGWMVNPTMYKDTQTHMFIHTNAGESHCYNTYCSGFVVVRSDFPPDITISPTSHHGKTPYAVNFFIHRETTSGNWWLSVSTPDMIPIGFWPEKIFGSLNKYGTYVSCGGETYSPPDKPLGYPPMGSGEYPAGITQEDAYAMNFQTVDDKLKTIDVIDTEKFMDTAKYYVLDRGMVTKYGHVLYFGGYGG